MRKIVFQVIQYKPFQILVESFAREPESPVPEISFSCTTLLALLKVAFENKVVKEGVAAVN